MATTSPVPSVHNMIHVSSSSAHHEIDVLKSFALEAAGGVDRLETLVETAAKQAHDDTKFLETASKTAADHVTRLEKNAADREAEGEVDKLRVIQAAERIKAQELRIAELEAASLEQSKTIQSLEADVDIRDGRISELKELEAMRYDDLKKQHARILELEKASQAAEPKVSENPGQEKKMIAHLYKINAEQRKELKSITVKNGELESMKKFWKRHNPNKEKVKKKNRALQKQVADLKRQLGRVVESDQELMPWPDVIQTNDLKQILYTEQELIAQASWEKKPRTRGPNQGTNDLGQAASTQTEQP